MAVSHALGISLHSGYLFRATQGNVGTSHPFPSDAGEARLKSYLADLPIGKKTLYNFRCATYYMQLLKTMGPDALSSMINSATQDTTEHYNSINKLLFEHAYIFQVYSTD